MKLFINKKKLQKEIKKINNINYVPTMGALHKGHESLIKLSKKKCEKTLVSIFINPSQFNNKSDLKKYPRKLNKDIKFLKKLKVDYLLTPKVTEIYRKQKYRKLKLNKKEKIMCAFFRPGHFEGVLGVINQFLLRFKPKFIVLGEKDYQQLILIKKLIKKKFKTKILSCPTIRGKNNVALSSRNVLLQKKDIVISSHISTLLMSYKSNLKKNLKNKKNLNCIIKKINNLNNIRIEYLEIRNKNNLSKFYNKNNFRIFLSYYNKSIRLIDNF